MRELESKRSATMFGRHPVLGVALAIVVLGSLGFAAAGGVGLLKSWFVTTEINGQVIDTREVVPDENGYASFTIPVPDTEGEAEISTTIQGTGDGHKTINVTLSGNEEGAQVEIQTEPEED
jgi:hypothetical protein